MTIWLPIGVSFGSLALAVFAFVDSRKSRKAAERSARAAEKALLIDATKFVIKRRNAVAQTVTNEGHATLHGVVLRVLRDGVPIGETLVETMYPNSAELLACDFAVERGDVFEFIWTSPTDAEGNPGKYHRRAI